jgi:FixJ family two-component response regulator
MQDEQRRRLAWIFRSDSVETQEVLARRFVAKLNASEVLLLECLVRGMSDADIAAAVGITLEAARRSRTTTLAKLSARSIADAVRTGLYAGVDLSK